MDSLLKKKGTVFIKSTLHPISTIFLRFTSIIGAHSMQKVLH